MDCPAAELVFSPGEHSWSVDFSGCTDSSSLEFDGDRYELLNVHIHSRSEHEVSGTNEIA
ncbi:unnamed protein product, partial [Hapterophycus canaliculatus]